MGSDTGQFQPRYVLPDGEVVDGLTLWQVKGGGWTSGRPIECPHGHRLDPGEVLVGTQACAEVLTGFHRTHTCRRCEATIYTPPIGPRCSHSAFDGRAARD
jgi:hypothetical protein